MPAGKLRLSLQHSLVEVALFYHVVPSMSFGIELTRFVCLHRCMVAVSGIAFTEFLGLTDNALKAGTLDYNFPLAPLIATQAVVMGFDEITRLNGWQETGYVSLHLHLYRNR